MTAHVMDRQTTSLKSFARFVVAAMLTGCAALPDQPGVPKNASTRWRKGDFTVVFRAGPQPFGEQRSYSSFVISRQFEELSGPTTIVVESAQNIEWFRWSPKYKPTDFIKLFLSRSGLTMLIEEVVPNECGPCTNYILVGADEKDDSGRQLTSLYLSFPRGKVPDRGTFPTEAEIAELTDTQISYRYPDGTKKTDSFKTLTKPEQRPAFP